MKRKILCGLTCLLLAILLVTPLTYAWFANTFEKNTYIESFVHKSYFESGDGTSATQFAGSNLQDDEGCAYEIKYPVQLYYFAWLQALGYFNVPVNGNGTPIDQIYFYLSSDLDMTGWVLPQVGTQTYPFVGNFDGNGHTISNLTVQNIEGTGADAWTDKPGNITGLNIVGFFGVIGSLNNSGTVNAAIASQNGYVPTAGYSYTNSVNEVKNFILEDATIKTDLSESLVGIAAGYVNGPMENVKVVGGTLSNVSATTALTYTTNLSDFGAVGFCTDAYKGSNNVITVLVYDPQVVTNSGHGSANGQGNNWGGSVDMLHMYGELTTINANATITTGSYNDEITITHHADGSETTVVNSSSGVAPLAVTIDGTQYTIKVTEVDDNGDTIASYSFVQRRDSSTDFLYLYGEKDVTTGTQTVHNIYEYEFETILIYSGSNYLTFNGSAFGNTTTEASATQWVNESGKLYTVRDTNDDGTPDTKFYISKANDNTLTYTSGVAIDAAAPAGATTWTIDGTNHWIYSGEWYLCYDNGWKLVQRERNLITESTTTHFLTISGAPAAVDDTTTSASALSWTKTTVSGGYYLSTIYNDATYYLMCNSHGVLSLESSPASPTVWNNIAADPISGAKAKIYSLTTDATHGYALVYGAGIGWYTTEYRTDGTGEDWGGSIDMRALFSRLDYVRNEYHVTYTNGDTSTNGYSETATGKNASGSGTYAFYHGTDNRIIYLTDSSSETAINYTISNETETVYNILCNSNYLNVNSTLDGVTGGASATSKWHLSSEGYLYTTVTKDYGASFLRQIVLFLNYSDNTLYLGNRGITQWGANASGNIYLTSDNTQFLTYDNIWKVAANRDAKIRIYQSNNTNNYLNINDSLNNITNGSTPTDWYAELITGDRYYVYCIVNGTRYYLTQPSKNVLAITAESNFVRGDYIGRRWMISTPLTSGAVVYRQNTGSYNNVVCICYSSGWKAYQYGDSNYSKSAGKITLVESAQSVTKTTWSANGTDYKVSVTSTSNTSTTGTSFPINNETGSLAPKASNPGYINAGADDSGMGSIRVSRYSIDKNNVSGQEHDLHLSITETSPGVFSIGTVYTPNSAMTGFTTMGSNNVAFSSKYYDHTVNGETVDGVITSFNSIINTNNPNGYVYGLHFTNSSISVSNISFRVREKGAITFMAGTYYNSENQVFFSLWYEDNGIYKQIDEIYEVGSTYRYKYVNESYSGGGTKIFDCDLLTSTNVTLDSLYYFEIPVIEGNYKMGSVSGRDGAYMMYLDISTSGEVEGDSLFYALSTTTLAYTKAGADIIFSTSSDTTRDVPVSTKPTYYPLAWNNGSVASSNTGYVISGANYEPQTGYPSDIRVSRYDKDLRNNNGSYSIWRSLNASGTLNNSAVYTIVNGTRQSITQYGIGNQNTQMYGRVVNDMNTLLDGEDYVYGLHFMNASISASNTVTVPKAIINGTTYTDYVMPEDCIDFRVQSRGRVTFFAGTFYSGSKVTCFFSLHQILRDNSGNITSIKEIDSIYGNGSSALYVYEFSDGTFAYSDNSATFNAVPNGYQKLFDMSVLSELNNGLTQDAVYYFEIPVDPGEFALGSAEGNGAYLLYLDIAANASFDIKTTITEVTKTTTNELVYPEGIAFVDSKTSTAFDTNSEADPEKYVSDPEKSVFLSIPISNSSGNTTFSITSGAAMTVTNTSSSLDGYTPQCVPIGASLTVNNGSSISMTGDVTIVEKVTEYDSSPNGSTVITVTTTTQTIRNGDITTIVSQEVTTILGGSSNTVTTDPAPTYDGHALIPNDLTAQTTTTAPIILEYSVSGSGLSASDARNGDLNIVTTDSTITISGDNYTVCDVVKVDDTVAGRYDITISGDAGTYTVSVTTLDGDFVFYFNGTQISSTGSNSVTIP